MPRLLITGGSGRLGRELRSYLSASGQTSAAPVVRAPGSDELDVTDHAEFLRQAVEFEAQVIVHAAAYTDVLAAEAGREACWRVNVEGTRNAALAATASGAKLVHISTDYVFWGDRGDYAEDDVPGPVRNYYALTKLVAEEAARAAEDHLVIRTSFRPREWQYPTAFADLYTSQDYVDVIAPEIAVAVLSANQIGYSTLHIGTERKSVLDLARRRSPEVLAGSRADAGVELPEDVSLDISRWQELRQRLKVAS